MITITKALRWGLHWLGEDAEARIRDLTRRAEGLQAAYDLLSASAEAERQEARELRAMLADKAVVLQEVARLRDLLTQAAGTLRKWNWTEDTIESFFALPGEARTHVFPVVSPSGIRGIVSVILERDAARDALRSTMEEKDRLLVQIAHAQDATAALQLELGGWQKEALRLREAIQNARQELRQGRSRLADTILAGVLGPPTESLSGDLGSKAPEVGRSGPWPGSQEEPERTRNERVDDLKRRLGLRCEHNAKQGACTADGCSFGARR